MDPDIDSLEERVRQLQAELQAATAELRQAKDRSVASANHAARLPGVQTIHKHASSKADNDDLAPHELPLALEEYRRYGRQLIMSEVGVAGQLRLKSSSVALLGAGGLGCPAAAYLAGAGVGTLGIVDGDLVEESNLHRQVIHTTDRVRMSKAESIKAHVELLNPLVKCHAYSEHLSPDNFKFILSQYDLIVDCTDNPASRYLISDAAVLLGKALISASALRTEGQLLVLNHPTGKPGAPGGPCYRCVFPKPPPAESVISCGEGGILGPVVGVMGVLQALEVIKIICKTSSSAEPGETAARPSMLMFSALETSTFRRFNLRGRRNDCRVCSSQANITLDSIQGNPGEYLQLCGASLPANVLRPDERIEPKALASSLQAEQQNPIIVDVREKPHFDVFHLPGSMNVPFSQLSQWREPDEVASHLDFSETKPIHVLCRLGNDSQVAVQKLKALGLDKHGDRYVGDVRGGWQAWRKDVPGFWPEY